MSLFDIYKAKKLGISSKALFAEAVGKRLKAFAEFNKWDEDWEPGTYSNTGVKDAVNYQVRSKNYIPCLPTTTYYFKGTGGNRICFYNADKEFVKVMFDKNNATFTVPSNCYYMTFNMGSSYGNVYKNDICINISKTEGSPKNGDYVPYKG